MTPSTLLHTSNLDGSVTQNGRFAGPGASRLRPVLTRPRPVPYECTCQADLGEPTDSCGLWLVDVDGVTSAHATRDLAEMHGDVATRTSYRVGSARAVLAS